MELVAYITVNKLLATTAAVNKLLTVHQLNNKTHYNSFQGNICLTAVKYTKRIAVKDMMLLNHINKWKLILRWKVSEQQNAGI